MSLRRVLGRVLSGALLVSTLTGCGSTLDSLGTDPDLPGTLLPLTPPASYTNTFLASGKSEQRIREKVDAAFEQLFFGDAVNEAIYFPKGDDFGLILDILHGNARTEGMGLGMLIAVELDQREVFDRLWNSSKAELRLDSGPAAGYFTSRCGEGPRGAPDPECLDDYGMQQFVLALIFANNRWQSSETRPYASDALGLLDLLQNRERDNGGVVEGIGSAFDATTHLVREEPILAAAGYTRSSMAMAASYELWAQATGDAFWSDAALAARAHVAAAADDTTGLWPIRSYFDGSPVPDSPEPSFTGQAYRTHLNLAIDALWGTAGAGETDVADRVLRFFAVEAASAQGFDKYGATFTLDGTPIDTSPSQALIAVNGALAVASSRADRMAFVDAVWAQAIPSGDNRYYEGLMYLMSLLVLSGQLHVY